MKLLFDGKGEPRAFIEAHFVYGMDGVPVGFLDGTRVHRLDGEYVGALHQDMIVNDYQSSPGRATSPGHPGRVPPADSPGGRGTFDYGYPCVLHKLFED